MRLAARLAAAVVAIATAAAAPASPVLLISLDGLRPGEVIDAQARGLKLPNLTALARQGAYASGVTGVLPTLTYPSHTTLITGVSPGRHGIGNNLTYDPLVQNQIGWFWYASDIKVPTLWEAAHAAGLKTANIHWPVSVAARGVDENLPQIWRTGTADDRKLMAALATPGLLPPLEAQLGPYAQGIDETAEGDAVRVRYAAAILARDHPAFTTIYLAGIDHQEHHDGPGSPEANAVIERTDALVGELVAAARKAMPDITIAVVSDHGFLPVAHDVNLFRPFIGAGLITLGADGKVSGWEAEPWIAGGTAAIVLARPQDAALRAKVAGVLAAIAADPANGIAAILDEAEVRRRGGPAEASFMIAMKPGFETGHDPAAAMVTPSSYHGMHGYLPDLPEMRSTLIVAGPALARHGDLGVIDMRSIAPSLARILGAKLPSAELPPTF
ncbi:alkaline phosphatase family protein [Sphingomonas nostoxanthinifaciens]|uniref:alkaline phosphatase family protein n=1 Tax=Sphingomonas nostoxanthinifaciens TaxID=2872652 RepID=UPI001CC1EA78|nr:ectonucleotide pyrophosphatase/phosphodiesterase [Sphingomonas nostoxanthinifaciens]UAK23375.1 ectonucleotide pyrophosphatase/phosphodiesterase [Sphingomonas nostoxanthinifaciens]